MSINILDEYLLLTLDWYSIDTPLTPWFSIDILVDSTVSRELTNFWSMYMSWLTHIGMSVEYWHWLRCQSRVSIKSNHGLWVPLVYMRFSFLKDLNVSRHIFVPYLCLTFAKVGSPIKISLLFITNSPKYNSPKVEKD